MTLLSKESGYIPSYKRTKLTDKLHKRLWIRTDLNSYQINDAKHYQIDETGKRAHRQKNSTYRCKTQKLAIPVIPRDSKLFCDN